MTDTRATLLLLATQLDARPIDPIRYCPTCWTPTVPTRRGDTIHATICRPCTNHELEQHE